MSTLFIFMFVILQLQSWELKGWEVARIQVAHVHMC